MILQNFDSFQYFDFSTAWNKTLKTIIESAPAKRMLERDFKIFVACKRNHYRARMMQANLPFDANAWAFEKGKLPADYDSCDWRYGRLPLWHQYVCHGACHYVANTLLYVAMVAYPNKAWRIVTSSKHSTIWDGEQTLFDLNFVTLNVPIHECIEDAFMQSDTVVLKVGEYMRLMAC